MTTLKIFIISSLASLFFTVSAVEKKTGSIAGKIIDKDIQQPLEYASVSIFRQADTSLVDGAITRADGSFVISNLPYNNYIVIVDFVGYLTQRIVNVKLSPEKNNIQIGNIPLEVSAKMLEGVEVVANKPKVEYRIDKKVINISQDISVSGGTAADALENTPSITVDVEGNVLLRGSSNYKVLINDKPTVLDAQDVLKQIPASSIENIEIITNPTAKYDPDGAAGIINIILKKETKQGVNGVVNTSIGYNEKYMGDFLLNYRHKKINYMIAGNIMNSQFLGGAVSGNNSYIGDSVTSVNTKADRIMKRVGQQIKAGIEYDITPKSSLSLTGETGNYDFLMNFISKDYSFNNPNTYNEYFYNESNSNTASRFYSGNMNFSHKFDAKGHDIMANIQHNSSKRNSEDKKDEYQTLSNYNRDGVEAYKTNITNAGDQTNTTIKIDYRKPINALSSFEAGYQSRLDNRDNEYAYEEYDTVINQWNTDSKYNNTLKFTENIHSLYSTYSNQFFGLNTKLGLRAEYTYRNTKQNKSDSKIERLDLFPTIHFSRTLPLDQEIQLSYTRRIDRPDGWSIAPDTVFWNKYARRVGNPALLPEYTNSYELGYQKKFKASFVSFETFFKNTVDKVERVRIPIGNNIMTHTWKNIGQDFSLGAELMANVVLSKAITLNGGVTMFRYWIKGTLLGEDINAESNNWRVRGSVMFKVLTNTRLQVNGMYNAREAEAQGYSDPSGGVDISLRQDFWNRKFSATFNVRDIFSTMSHSHYSYGTGFDSYFVSSMESPIFMLTLSYKINNYRDQRNGKGGEGAPDIDFGGGF